MRVPSLVLPVDDAVENRTEITIFAFFPICFMEYMFHTQQYTKSNPGSTGEMNG